jgi:hypothetical protein
MSETIGGVRHQDDRLKGIGGWLLLPLLHLVIWTVLSLGELGKALAFQGTAAERVFMIGWAGTFLVLYLFCFWRFIRQKKGTRWLMIGLYALEIVVGLGTLYFFYQLPADQRGVEDMREILNLVPSILLIGYFLRSERVEQTFVN